MNRSLAAISAAALLVCASTATVDAASTSPGKNSAYESFSGALPQTGAPAAILTATIAKGKPKRVLEAIATISVTGTSGATGYNISGRLDANGVPMEIPATVGVNGNQVHANYCYSDGTTPPEGCALTIVGWLDLDAAEAANPGVFKKQPINVVLTGGGFDAFVGGVSGEAILSVRMEKK